MQYQYCLIYYSVVFDNKLIIFIQASDFWSIARGVGGATRAAGALPGSIGGAARDVGGGHQAASGASQGASEASQASIGGRHKGRRGWPPSSIGGATKDVGGATRSSRGASGRNRRKEPGGIAGYRPEELRGIVQKSCEVSQRRAAERDPRKGPREGIALWTFCNSSTSSK